MPWSAASARPVLLVLAAGGRFAVVCAQRRDRHCRFSAPAVSNRGHRLARYLERRNTHVQLLCLSSDDVQLLCLLFTLYRFGVPAGVFYDGQCR